MRQYGAVAAVDLGATSGRVVLGRFGPSSFTFEDVHRFSNRPVRTRDGLHWNILELYREVFEGLRKAVAAEPDLLSIGIDSWAVDYGLVRRGRLLGTPYHYRDERCERGVASVEQVVDAATLYAENGLQHLPFTTVYQLAVDRDEELLDPATGILLIPDLIAYWLTGQQRAERTNASTTGLLNIKDGRWNNALTNTLGLPSTLFPSLIDPGQRIGRVTDEITHQLGITDLDVIAVGSHDTASAVAAIPLTGPHDAYISSGTWALIGCEREQPVLTEESRAANFTNELGVDGRIRYLRNVMGMWILNECVNAWHRTEPTVRLEQLVDSARGAARWAIFDVNHPSLQPAGDMPSRVTTLLARQGLPQPTPAEMVRSIIESLASAYAATLDELVRLTGTPIDRVHVVGGGSQNTLLCQLIADRSARLVQAGPVEATAIGNILIQARSAGLVASSLHDIRATVTQHTSISRYTPSAPLPPPRAQHS
jgi:rhamnulokinase